MYLENLHFGGRRQTSTDDGRRNDTTEARRMTSTDAREFILDHPKIPPYLEYARDQWAGITLGGGGELDMGSSP